MKLKVIRDVPYTEKDPKTDKDVEMRRLLIRDELGNTDVIRVKADATEEEIAEAFIAKRGEKGELEGKTIEVTVKES